MSPRVERGQHALVVDADLPDGRQPLVQLIHILFRQKNNTPWTTSLVRNQLLMQVNNEITYFFILYLFISVLFDLNLENRAKWIKLPLTGRNYVRGVNFINFWSVACQKNFEEHRVKEIMLRLCQNQWNNLCQCLSGVSTNAPCTGCTWCAAVRRCPGWWPALHSAAERHFHPPSPRRTHTESASRSAPATVQPQTPINTSMHRLVMTSRVFRPRAVLNFGSSEIKVTFDHRAD